MFISTTTLTVHWFVIVHYSEKGEDNLPHFWHKGFAGVLPMQSPVYTPFLATLPFYPKNGVSSLSH
jgi:hypothetical protein